nr:hypothetical protein [Cressdnaviricota sp.]
MPVTTRQGTKGILPPFFHTDTAILRGVLPGPTYRAFAAQDRGVHGWFNKRVRAHRLRSAAGAIFAGAQTLGSLGAAAYNWWNKPQTMAKQRRRTIYRRRRRTMKKRIYKKKFMKKRTYRRRRSAARKDVTRRMARTPLYKYTKTYDFNRGFDHIDFGPVKPELGTTANVSANAKLKVLSFTIGDLARLKEKLNSFTSAAGNSNHNKLFRIDKIVYKVLVENAKALTMDPSFKAPDGSGTNMTNEQDFVNNSYVFHLRSEQDDQADTNSFTDWSYLKYARKGAVKFVSLFRQRGKMFPCSFRVIQKNTNQEAATDLVTRKDNINPGWIRYDASGLNTFPVKLANIILPGLDGKGWDGQVNMTPQLRVTARVYWSTKGNLYSIDTF